MAKDDRPNKNTSMNALVADLMNYQPPKKMPDDHNAILVTIALKGVGKKCSRPTIDVTVPFGVIKGGTKAINGFVGDAIKALDCYYVSHTIKNTVAAKATA